MLRAPRSVTIGFLAVFSSACTVSDALEAVPSKAVAGVVSDGSHAVSQAATDAAAQLGLSTSSAPSPGTHAAPSGGAVARARTTAPKPPPPPGPAVGAEPPPDSRAIPESAHVESGPAEEREAVEDVPPVLSSAHAAYATAPRSPAVAAPQDRIYSEADTDVIPAVLLTTKEAGPIFQGIRGSMNTMELLISRDGRVDSVRLITRATRLTDMLLLSGAKTWKFAPAFKDGQPVRYRAKFSWEATP